MYKARQESEKIVGSAIANNAEVNERKWLLGRHLVLVTPYELISTEEIMASYKSEDKDDWHAFYERHPDSGGCIELFAVGYNSTKL